MIKNIIWDNIGVFTPLYYDSTIGKAAEFLGVEKEELKSVWLKEAVFLDRGDISAEEFHIRLMKAFNVHKGLKEVMDAHYSTYKRREDVRDLAKQLSKRFNQILLTNFGDNFDEWNDNVWKMNEIFGDKIIVSYKIRMVKPEPEIFKYTMEKYGIKPEETIFIDDSEKNVLAAKRLGIHAIQFKSLEKLKEDLKEYGVLDEVLR